MYSTKFSTSTYLKVPWTAIFKRGKQYSYYPILDLNPGPIYTGQMAR